MIGSFVLGLIVGFVLGALVLFGCFALIGAAKNAKELERLRAQAKRNGS